MKRFLFIAAVVTAQLIALPCLAFGVKPAKFRLTIDPGQSQTLILTTINDEKSAQTFSIGTVGVNLDETGQKLQFISGSDRAELWLKPDVKTVTLAPGTKKTIGAVLSVPKDAEAGSHVIAFTVTPVAAAGTTAVTSQIASIVNLDVAGTVHEDVSVEHWQVSAAAGGFATDLQLKNNGTVTVPLKGHVRITNWLGQEVASDDIGLGSMFLPGTLRTVHLAIKGNHMVPGLYTGAVDVTYGRSGAHARAEARFWVVPPYLLFGVGILVAIVIIFRKKPRVL